VVSLLPYNSNGNIHVSQQNGKLLRAVSGKSVNDVEITQHSLSPRWSLTANALLVRVRQIKRIGRVKLFNIRLYATLCFNHFQ